MDDINSVWYNALYSVILNLIRQYVVISVNSICTPKVFCVLLHNILHTIPILKNNFDNLTLKHKLMLLVANIGMDLTWISLEIHKCNLDLEVLLFLALTFAVSSPFTTSLSSICAYATFMEVIYKTKVPYKKTANKKKKVIFQKWAKKIVKLLQTAKFLLCAFKLDCQHALLMAVEIADTISPKYKRFFLWVKTKFHTKKVKVKIAYLRMLISQSCHYINEMKSELKYIKSFEKAWTKETNIFKAICK